MASKAKVAKKAAPKRKGAAGYKLPEPIPNGEVLQDMNKKKWRIGPSIGIGGFGEIYSACEHESTPKKTSLYPYVIKIEPHGNGPLFVEMHFYMRNAKQDDIQEFTKSQGLSSLGMPVYIGAGSHECRGEKYRFVVMERYAKDLWCRFLESGRLFPTHTVYRIAMQMIDVLQYIHGRSYVHADIKGGNILFGLKKGSENQAYLVDFGLASHYSINKDYKPDPKKAHNGTIEYTSRDAHNGVPTRRGDLEILAYNVVQWLCGALPWETDLRHPTQVQAAKEAAMKDVPAFLRKAFSKSAAPGPVTSFFQYVSKLEHNDTPDYRKCKQMFETGLKTLGFSNTCNLDFTPTKPDAKSAKKKLNTSKTPVIKTEDTSDEDTPDLVKTTKPAKKVVKAVKRVAKKPEEVRTPLPKMMTTAATQTSLEKPKNKNLDLSLNGRSKRGSRQVVNYNDAESDSDVIDNSFVETPSKRAVKRKHTKKVEVEYASDEEVTIQTTIKKKQVAVERPEVKSWKNSPAIINGRVRRNQS